MLCVEASLTISSRYLSTSRTSSGSFPPSEVTFHVPRASLSIRWIGPPRSPLPSAAQSSLHRSLTVPPACVGPTGGWSRVSHSGLARLGPARNNPATRRYPASPDPRPGSRVGPRLRRTGRRHVPQFCSHHEGFSNRSLSDPSPRACLPWEMNKYPHEIKK
ncbi:hypothetical protein ILYODFUR_038830 [Ilyodon furcidens]|uniref:Uncharacterized protein n=1 Tax=Ilyodon furcidens TaxID=33524 RepID=A0ABV0T576_9TELE